MNRRKFLGMLGIAPIIAALPHTAKRELFWEGTTVPRHMPFPSRWDGRDGVSHKVRIEGFGTLVNFPDLPVHIQKELLRKVYG